MHAGLCANNNSKIIMMKYVSIVLLIICVTSQNQQKFAYISNETLTIQVNSLLQMSLSLSTASDEYLSQATVQAILKINQSTSIFYNLIYFDNQTPAGKQCYQNWIMSSTQLATYKCSKYDFSKDNLPACMNFTNCQYEDIIFTLHLSQQLYKQSFILIQNSDSNTDLVLQTQIKMELSSQNAWFYWGVGLTCLLLISLVIYAGVIFYWMLKYKKMKKMFEQFKLTEEQESIKKGQ